VGSSLPPQGPPTLSAGAHRGRLPALAWGAGYASLLTFWQPPENVQAWSEPRGGGARARGPAWGDDVASTGHRSLWAGTVTVPPLERPSQWDPATLATGWDTPAGAAWADALDWLHRRNVGRFYPLAGAGLYLPVMLVEPGPDDPPTPAWAGYRQLRLVLRSVDDAPFPGY
jgi:hypothetical protein